MRGGVFISIALFSLLSCETSPETVTDAGLDYFPLKVGAYQVYSVDETQINQSVEQKSIYELKFQVIDSLINQEGGYTYIIQRQSRANANLPWNMLDSWTARIAGRQAIINEGNTSFVKLTFPAVNGLEWDGNAFNSLVGNKQCGDNLDRLCDIYTLENFGTEFITSTGITFGQALTIIQNEDPDLITKHDVRTEMYAKGVGLIYKESVVLEYCSTDDCKGDQKVDKGLKYKQVIKEYGSD
jgi:hypothetical protein